MGKKTAAWLIFSALMAGFLGGCSSGREAAMPLAGPDTSNGADVTATKGPISPTEAKSRTETVLFMSKDEEDPLATESRDAFLNKTLASESVFQYACGDAGRQAEQIASWLGRDVKIFVIDPVDGGSLGEVLSQAEEEGICVISYDRLIMNTAAVDYSVCFNFRQAGLDIAEKIIKQYRLDPEAEGASGEPLLIRFIEPEERTHESIYLFGGVKEGLRGCFDNQSLASTEEGPADLVITADDGDALACLADFEDGEEVPFVSGFGAGVEAVSSIARGSLSLTLYEDSQELAKSCADLCRAILAGEEMPELDKSHGDNGGRLVPTLYESLDLIDRDNFMLLVDSGFYSLSELDVEKLSGL